MKKLIFSRRFAPLLITQFLGAFNDNLFKNALLTLVALKMADQAHILSNIIAGVFILPFFLFSATAGEVADKFARHKIARVLKALEIILMLGVAVSYAFHNITLLVIIMALMGTQSAFFGPVKYALLPQQLTKDELITGNAYIEASTYLAILSGLIFGTLLPTPISIALLVTLAIAGYVSSFQILPAPAFRPKLQIRFNIFSALALNYRFLKRQKPLFQSIMGATWFWVLGAFIAVQIYPICSQILNADETVISLFLVLFSLGVATGTYVCNCLLKGEISIVFAPLCALGMAICLFILGALCQNYPTSPEIMNMAEFFNAPRAFMFLFNLFMLAFLGGIYIVPFNAFMQHRAPKAYAATVIAGNNVLNALGMTLIAFLTVILFQFGFSLVQMFYLISAMGLAVTLYICRQLPDFFTRSVLRTLLQLMFKTKVYGLSNFQKAGRKTVIIANHVSLWDGMLLAAFMPERITFAIDRSWTQKWYMPVIRLLADFYPVDAENPLSVRHLIEEIKKGRHVMIFPEGRISLTGKVMQVFDGAAMVAARAGAKLLPIRIDGAQYSKLSYVKDKFNCRWFPRINLHILPAKHFDLPISKNERRQTAHKLYNLMIEMMYSTSNQPKNIFSALQKSAKRYGKGHVIGLEMNGQKLTYGGLIRGAASLGEALRPLLKDEYIIGVCLSHGISFLKVFFALQYLGKSVALIDPENAFQQLQDSGVKVCLTTQNMDLQNKRVLNIETLQPKHVFRICPEKGHQTRLIGFVSGKKTEISFSKILENVRALDTVLPFNNADVALNGLPSDDIKSLVLATLLPLLSGVKSIYFPKAYASFMPRLSYHFSATLVFADEAMYVAAEDQATAFDFFNLKMAFLIGPKADTKLLDTWLKAYGVRLLEGSTDQNTALFQSINTPLYYRFNTLGCPLPGVGLQTDFDGFVQP